MSSMAHVVLKSQYVNGVTFSMIKHLKRLKQNIVNGSSYCRKAQVFGAETEVSKRVFS